MAFGKQYDLVDMRELKDARGMGQGVAELSERWREMGILEVSDETPIEYALTRTGIARAGRLQLNDLRNVYA